MTTASHGKSDLSCAEIVGQIRKHIRITLSSRELSRLLEASEIIRDDDTCMAGRIRVLSLECIIMVQ
jgi:hypothetical protein